MAYEQPKILSVSGRTITIAHLELPSQPKSYTTTDAAAAAVSLTVIDNVGFSQNQLVMLGSLGAKKSEIKTVNAAVTAGTALTITAATFAHEGGTQVQRVLFNQWKIYGNSANSTSGASLIATVDLTVDAPYTSYVNSGTEYAYYFALPYDSVNSITGDAYSDGVASATGYSENTVGYVIQAALKDVKIEEPNRIESGKTLGEVNECLRYMSGKLKHWSAMENFNYALGVASRGTFSYTMPSDAEDTNSLKSILDVRVGSDTSLRPVDKKELESLKQGIVQTTVRTQALSGDTTLAITNSYDYADAGTVNIYINGTKYTITYTGVTRSATTGILTGVPASGTGSISVTTPAGTNVFQNEKEGLPLYFSVYDGIMEIFPMPDGTYDNQNVWMDYFTSKTSVDSYSDSLSGFRYDAVKHWLIWKLRAFTSNSTGKLDVTDGNFVMFNAILKDQIRLETTSQRFKMRPKINSINYGGRKPPQVVT